MITEKIRIIIDFVSLAIGKPVRQIQCVQFGDLQIFANFSRNWQNLTKIGKIKEIRDSKNAQWKVRSIGNTNLYTEWYASVYIESFLLEMLCASIFQYKSNLSVSHKLGICFPELSFLLIYTSSKHSTPLCEIVSSHKSFRTKIDLVPKPVGRNWEKLYR